MNSQTFNNFNQRTFRYRNRKSNNFNSRRVNPNYSIRRQAQRNNNRFNRNPAFRYRFNYLQNNIRNPIRYFNNNSKPNFNQNNRLNKSIQDITKLIKKTSLSGGPLKSLNSNNKKNINDPNNVKKEIRYDKLYNAFDMYNMGKYYSFYKTTNMILRIAIYSTYNITFNSNINCSFMWLPYAYPYLDERFEITSASKQYKPDCYCDFYWGEKESLINTPPTTLSSIPGMYRLISASLKVSNITTNSLKGGSYTVYRVTRNEVQPIFYNKSEGLDYSDPPFDIVRSAMENYNYENEPTKYLYNANQICQCNEYGVIQGNDIFQDCTEYMGCNTVMTSLYHAGTVGGLVDNFNPNGVNVKYIGIFDTTTTQQSYKFQSVKIFEVTPYSSNSLSAAAFKGSKSVTPNVIMQAKNKFNLECIDS